MEFNSLYTTDNPSVGEVMNLLKKEGFEFINLDLLGNSFAPYSDFHSQPTHGQLIGCDAVFVRPLEWASDRQLADIIDYTIFCLLNNIEDLAIKLLIEKTRTATLPKALK